MSKQQIIDDLSSRLDAYKKYASDLEMRQSVAIDALRDLSRGLGLKFESMNGWHEAMEKLAAHKLAELAKLSLRKP